MAATERLPSRPETNDNFIRVTEGWYDSASSEEDEIGPDASAIVKEYAKIREKEKKGHEFYKKHRIPARAKILHQKPLVRKFYKACAGVDASSKEMRQPKLREAIGLEAFAAKKVDEHQKEEKKKEESKEN